ncbi:MAG: hypothetical protein SPG03_09370 [Veillonella caviae]|uniref:hypothetical protein n=1 Tax=Veillonella caviae TaxID=248316 RepID=UPI002A914902|nr:hypothetical protein [Veillonella caviae]MDY5482564.1 hypothetical protein [Veillonella caviae]
MCKYKIKREFKILNFSGKKVYIEKGYSDSIFEISNTMEELLLLLKDGVTEEEMHNYFFTTYNINENLLHENLTKYIKILLSKDIIEKY